MSVTGEPHLEFHRLPSRRLVYDQSRPFLCYFSKCKYTRYMYNDDPLRQRRPHTHTSQVTKVTHTQTLLHSKAGRAGRISLHLPMLRCPTGFSLIRVFIPLHVFCPLCHWTPVVQPCPVLVNTPHHVAARSRAVARSAQHHDHGAAPRPRLGDRCATVLGAQREQGGAGHSAELPLRRAAHAATCADA